MADLDQEQWVSSCSEAGAYLVQSLVDSGAGFPPDSIDGVLQLPFYKTHLLCRFIDSRYAIPKTWHAFIGQGKCVLAGCEPYAMYQVNERESLELTSENVETYVSWLFRLWSYRQPIYVEPSTRLRWGDGIPNALRMRFQETAHFPCLKGRDENGNYLVGVTQISRSALHGPGTLYEVLVRVRSHTVSPIRPCGYVEVVAGSEKLLMADLHIWK